MPDPDSPAELPAELLALTEQIAERIHVLWSAGRRREGWRYGPHRDDATKEHPGLVPYAQLSDGEKEFDRVTALGALRAIVQMGYRIVPPNAPEEPIP